LSRSRGWSSRSKSQNKEAGEAAANTLARAATAAAKCRRVGTTTNWRRVAAVAANCRRVGATGAAGARELKEQKKGKKEMQQNKP
jgi:hypothetical protein